MDVLMPEAVERLYGHLFNLDQEAAADLAALP
jgi:hypothetical protein